jgi:NADH:ubiquinone reductase (H+-translocating)
MADKKRIVILGGGFGGLYTALELERQLAGRSDLDVLLVSADNFFVFTPMLHEIAASDLDLTTAVNPIRKLLKRVRFFCGQCESIDVDRRSVRLWHGDDQHHHDVEFDHLVVGLGAVTSFHGLPGLKGRAMTMKSLGDGVALRNRMIANLEEADFECCADKRERLLTFVVAGGGFAGVETAGAINDFLHHSLRFYPNLSRKDVRILLVHSGNVVLPELSERLGTYAQRQLTARGVEIRTGTRVAEYAGEHVVLSDNTRIRTDTRVWTAGLSPHPLVASLNCQKDRGRIKVDACLRAIGAPAVWSLGDCAAVPDLRTGGIHPPTAQHAIREATCLARNLCATFDGREPQPFRFRTIGQLASLGRRTGVASIFGLNFSGFIAWWMWRTIYLSKLPRLEKKVRVALDWTLDLVFSKDLVQFKTAAAPHTSHSVRQPARAMLSSIVKSELGSLRDRQNTVTAGPPGASKAWMPASVGVPPASSYVLTQCGESMPASMTCRELIGFLDDYVDGKVVGAAKVAFDSHLLVCGDCREYLRTYGDTMKLTRGAGAMADETAAGVPEGLVRAVLAATKPLP